MLKRLSFNPDLNRKAGKGRGKNETSLPMASGAAVGPEARTPRARSISILFQLGFRPFFLGAGMIAVLFMILWTASYSFGWAHSLAMSSIHWDALRLCDGRDCGIPADGGL